MQVLGAYALEKYQTETFELILDWPSENSFPKKQEISSS